MSVVAPLTYEEQLHEAVSEYYADPLGFVLFAWDWPVKGEPGPDAWQAQVLQELAAAVRERGFNGHDPVLAIREAISSGHGIGKSVLIAFTLIWLMASRPHSKWTITANTNDQLEKKTWASIREWLSTSIVAHWFEINSAIMYRKGHRATWFAAPQTCAEENSEAFAGQHAKDSSSGYLFDEASAIPPKIWEVAEGGLTDGEPWFLAFGNMTRNTGAFYEAVFGRFRERWHSHVIDSRTCKFSNKLQIAQWAEDYGEESDFFKVRVRGLAPNASEDQFIDLERVHGAQNREVHELASEPLIAGVDVSGGGSAWTVCRFRQGMDARSRKPIRITGERSRDLDHVASVLGERLSDTSDPIAAMFVDTAFGSAVVERLNNWGYKQVHRVDFGAPAPDPTCLNMRAFMWKRSKIWLQTGAIPKDDYRLEKDLTAPGFHLNSKNQLVLESKEHMMDRGVPSPDDGDGHALTFPQTVRVARQVRPPLGVGQPVSRPVPTGEGSWAV